MANDMRRVGGEGLHGLIIPGNLPKRPNSVLWFLSTYFVHLWCGNGRFQDDSGKRSIITTDWNADSCKHVKIWKNGPLLVPNEARYQAAPHPE